MGLFKKKINMTYKLGMTYKPLFKATSFHEQYDELKEAYENLEHDYNQEKKTVVEQLEFILQLQNKIYELQKELIAKNKIIQDMDDADQ